MNIRTATPADAAATSPAQMAEHVAEAARLFVVAHDSHGLAGFTSLKNGTRISQFFVQPRHGGQGLGRRI